MFGVSFEHLVILAIVLLIFGPRKLPELGYTLGKAIRNFKEAISGLEEAKFQRVDPSVTAQVPVETARLTAGARVSPHPLPSSTMDSEASSHPSTPANS